MKKANETLKALSIIQPWAECILNYGKNIENRSWDTKYRGFVAVHSSGKSDKSRFEDCEDEYRLRITPEDVDFGAIIGFAEIVDVVTSRTLSRSTKKWFQGDYGFHLKNIIKLKKPVKAKGALGFWKISGKLRKKVLSELSPTQRKKILKNLLRKVED